MKFITKIIPIVGIIVTTLILLIFIDTKEYQKYDQLDGYQSESFSIEYDSLASFIRPRALCSVKRMRGRIFGIS